MAGTITRGFHNQVGPFDVLTDHDSRALGMIDTEHIHIHDGVHFLCGHYFSDIDNTDYGRIRFKTGDNTKEIHALFFANCSVGAIFALYEDALFTHVPANAISIFSRNRNSSNDPHIEEICHTPGGSGSGNIISPIYTFGTGGNPSQANPGQGRDEGEYILKPDTVYLMVVQSLADNNRVTMGFDFYYIEEN